MITRGLRASCIRPSWQALAATLLLQQQQELTQQQQQQWVRQLQSRCLCAVFQGHPAALMVR
jgi:hypothetical protein